MKSHRHSYLITFGHICTDITQGGLPAMLPFLIGAYGLSYMQAAALMFACSIVSSVVQPLFGYMGDKLDRPWFMSLGILLAGVGIAAIGFVESYWLMFLSASVCGVGVALFHPEGGKLANVIAGSNKGAGLSNFSVGGNVGFALGPLIATFALGVFGIHGTAIFLIPTIVMAAILLRQTPAYQHFSALEVKRKQASGQSETKDDWVGFMKVTSINFMRSIIGNGLIVFIPLYWIAVLHQPVRLATIMLTLFSGFGAIATFFGGRIADKIGFKRMIVISYVLAAPLLLIFVLTSNLILATVLVVLVSICQSAAYSPIIALGQSYLPSRLGLASGISLGVVVSVGGMTSPLIGLVGDNFGLTASMAILCVVAFLSAGLSLFVARHKRSG